MEKLKKLRQKFDYITSQNTTNAKLALFWIITFELFASSFEYLFFDNTQIFIATFPSGLLSELVIGVLFTLFMWLSVYNFIFWNRSNLLFLMLFAITGLYLIITKDITFNFLMHNLEPLHFFNQGIGIALIVELFIKLIILYLIYKLIRIYRQA